MNFAMVSIHLKMSQNKSELCVALSVKFIERIQKGLMFHLSQKGNLILRGRGRSKALFSYVCLLNNNICFF